MNVRIYLWDFQPAIALIGEFSDFVIEMDRDTLNFQTIAR